MTAVPPEPVPVQAALSALAEPLVAVPRRWVAWVTLAGLGLWAGFFGPIQVLLAQQAQAVAPGDKELVFGVVTGVGVGGLGDRQPAGRGAVGPHHLEVRAAGALGGGRRPARAPSRWCCSPRPSRC